MRGHRCWAEIDVGAIRHNLQVVRDHVGKHVQVLAVVKADAYGHGAVPVAYQAIESGCAMLGVGDSSEALELRQSGITARTLILGAIIEEEIPQVVEADIDITIHSRDLLPLLDAEARRQNRLVRVHLKIDTGMTRLGVSCEGAPAVLEAIHDHPNLRLSGVSTHIASSTHLEYTREQLAHFRATINALKLDVENCAIHAANSATLFAVPESHFDMVRPGIAMYGVLPLHPQLKPALTLKTRIAYLKTVPTGTFVGYEQRYQTQTDTLIATCPVGYNDGYPWLLSNRADVLVQGRRARVVGTVTMDYIMIDVGHIPGVRVGDEVTLIGRDGSGAITVEELAKLAGTIPYEITCRLGKRVKRIYVDESRAPATVKGWTVTRTRG